MALTWIRRLRRTVGVIWVALFLGLVSLVVLTFVAPKLGMTIFIIRGGSMAPSIPLGAIVVDVPPNIAKIAVGDVISVGTPTGVVYTHRVVGIDPSGPERRFQIQGDANPSPDPALVPASAVVGQVSWFAPVVGYVVALLTLPTGILSVASMLGSLLLTYWLLEDLEDEEREYALEGMPRTVADPGPVPDAPPLPQPGAPRPTTSVPA
jgi:signal peptidase I